MGRPCWPPSGAGWYPDVESATNRLIEAKPAAQPGPDVARYQEFRQVYRELYPALYPTYHRGEAATPG